ncbi:armadillo-type protein [Entophlyctis helioformis]|nr:armadillo-type protein [Entophlyctis helioformis]
MDRLLERLSSASCSTAEPFFNEDIAGFVSFGSAHWTAHPNLRPFVLALTRIFGEYGKQDAAHSAAVQAMVPSAVGFLLDRCQDAIANGVTMASAHSSAETDLADILRALSTVLFENGPHCAQVHGQLLIVLERLIKLDDGSDTLDARRLAIACLGNLCAKTGSKHHVLHMQIYGILIQQFDQHGHGPVSRSVGPGLGRNKTGQQARGAVLSVHNPQLLVQAIRSMLILVNESKAVASEACSRLLPLLGQIIFTESLGSSVSASQARLPVPAGPWRRLESDSDASDMDVLMPRRPQRSSDTKMRTCALQLLTAFSNACPKQVLPHLTNFLTPHEQEPVTVPLIDMITISPDPRQRVAASQAFCSLLENAKPHLAMAEHSGSQSPSFMTLSQRLANQVHAMHKSILPRLREERHSPTLYLLICALTALVECSPYSRLAYDFRADIVCIVERHLNHSDMTIKARIAECFAVLLDTSAVAPQERSHEARPSWLDLTPPIIDRLSDAATDKTVQLRVPALGACAAVARNQPALFGMLWDAKLSPVFKQTRIDADPATRIASAKMLEQFAHSCSTHAVPHEAMPTGWWLEILPVICGPLAVDRMYAVRTLAASTIGQIPEADMRNLPSDLQAECWAATEELLADEHQDVRAAAWGALGVLLGHCLDKNDADLARLAALMPSATRDKSTMVKIRAAWALGNLGEALLRRQQQQQQQHPAPKPPMSLDVLLDLVDAANRLTSEHDKCGANGARAIHILVRLLHTQCDSPPHAYAPRIDRCLDKAAQVAIKVAKSGSFKARWNACSLLGGLLCSPHSLVRYLAWRMPLYDALVSAATVCPNFKVKISAVSAMACVAHAPATENAGAVKCMHAILGALEKIDQSVSDSRFGEFKYKSQLKNTAMATADLLAASSLGAARAEVDELASRIRSLCQLPD